MAKNTCKRPFQGQRHTKAKHCKVCNLHYIDVGGGHQCSGVWHGSSGTTKPKGWKKGRK